MPPNRLAEGHTPSYEYDVIRWKPRARGRAAWLDRPHGSTWGIFSAPHALDPLARKEVTQPMTTATAPSAPLSALDRCDRCGAQAYLRVLLASGGELLFCAHHAREHAPKLREVAAEMHDETGKLASPTVSGSDD